MEPTWLVITGQALLFQGMQDALNNLPTTHPNYFTWTMHNNTLGWAIVLHHI